MAKYQKSGGTSGAWAKASEIVSGTKVKLVGETEPIQGQFGVQNVAKARFQGGEEAVNIALNKTSINGLVTAFGEDSKDWIGKVLTAVTEKSTVSGRRVMVLYLVPEGYELSEDGSGYLTVTPKDQKAALKPPAIVARQRSKEEVSEEDTRDVPVEAYDDAPNPDDIPW